MEDQVIGSAWQLCLNEFIKMFDIYLYSTVSTYRHEVMGYYWMNLILNS